MKEIILLLSILFSIGIVSSQFVYDNPTLPKLNMNNITTNGTGQIPANIVNKTTGTYYLNQLMDSIIDQLYVLISSSTNSTFINDTYVPYIGATKNVDLGNHNLTAQEINVEEGYKVSFSDNSSLAYLYYNSTSRRLEMWVNGKIQQDWGNSTTIYGKATFEADAFFQNLSGAGLLINTNVLVIGNMTSDNVFAGNICYSDGTNCTFANITVINNSLNNINQTLYNYIYNVNYTLTNLSKVNTFYDYNKITTVGGDGGNYSNRLNFMITRITVTPSNPTTKYRYRATLLSDNTVIDEDRIVHIGTWDIYKTASISNDILVSNITNSIPTSMNFTIKITYSSNFK